MTDNQSPENDTEAVPVKRPTPAVSAATRARRIGGVRPTAGAGTSATPVPLSKDRSEPVSPADRARAGKSGHDAAPVSGAVTGPSATGAAAGSAVGSAGGEPVKTSPGGKSVGSGEPIVITQVPAWLRWAPALVLTVCAIVMIVLVAVTAHSVWYAKPSAASLREQVLAAAKSCVVATNTYQYTDIPKFAAAGAKCTTGRYTSQYASAMTKIVTPAATKLKASQSVQINAAGIEAISQSGKQWDVVLYGQTTIVQKSVKTKDASRIDPFALTAIMQRVGGKWLISHVGLLTSTSS